MMSTFQRILVRKIQKHLDKVSVFFTILPLKSRLREYAPGVPMPGEVIAGNTDTATGHY